MSKLEKTIYEHVITIENTLDRISRMLDECVGEVQAMGRENPSYSVTCNEIKAILYGEIMHHDKTKESIVKFREIGNI